MGRSPHHEAVEAAIDLFTRQGYENTTVDEIADAAGISRATFFRRFGSKEDVVFADHEVLLEQVVGQLAESRQSPRSTDPLVEVCRAARLVFDHHISQPDTSLARHALLQQVPGLRDRELITTHRYERAFTRYLRATLPTERQTTTTTIAFSASVVAVHNAYLRAWLRDPDGDPRPGLEEGFADLRRAARASSARAPLTETTAGSASGDAVAAPAHHAETADGGASDRVVVTVLEVPAGRTADDVARAVREALA
ncbi:TetR/AcrR family transcriptional regulator [Paraoerskovia marina]|uniref:TetR/AcrR family transcriptional regulator n=1 Tax=Paraoerskovia marina TaxID=545619 RepID=UPI000492B6D3|nr:TetR/AcrR family transcriptional regulator [Paraoerskovia marina]